MTIGMSLQFIDHSLGYVFLFFIQEFIMEAYADPLKFYPPDPPNQTDVKETVKQMTSNAKDLKDVNLNNIAGIGEKEFCEMFDAFRTNDTLVRFSAVNCEVSTT